LTSYKGGDYSGRIRIGDVKSKQKRRGLQARPFFWSASTMNWVELVLTQFLLVAMSRQK
jgi:hypothetical protein